jgi:hypothetical protein
MAQVSNHLPNFFVIGAPKAGTTALYHCLKQHPDIYMSPVKEPLYFIYDSEYPVSRHRAGTFVQKIVIDQPRDYYMLFAQVANQHAVGEASPLSLRSARAAERIHQSLPQARLIAILRQPAERAYSHYLFMRFNRYAEPASSFAQALAQEEARRQANWFSGFFYRTNGYYYSQLRPYYDLFPPEQIKIYLYEDWNSAPQRTLEDIFRFLEVDEAFTPVIRRSNVTQFPHNYSIHKFINQPSRLERALRFIPAGMRNKIIMTAQTWNQQHNLIPPPPIDAEIRRQLTEGYREDILKLQELIGRDLSGWMK